MEKDAINLSEYLISSLIQKS